MRGPERVDVEEAQPAPATADRGRLHASRGALPRPTVLLASRGGLAEELAAYLEEHGCVASRSYS